MYDVQGIYTANLTNNFKNSTSLCKIAQTCTPN